MITTRAAVTGAVGAGFAIRDVTLQEPGRHEVVVRLVATGICHTDLNVECGNIPFPLPGVLGHEGAGVVEQVGTSVTRVVPGDKVILTFASCGRCAKCRAGQVALCDYHLPWNLIGGRRPDGTSAISLDGQVLSGHFFGQSSFSAYASVNERSIVRLEPDTSHDELRRFAPLGCGFQTGAGAILNILRPRPGDTVTVAGAGAVGLAAVMAAALTASRRIVVVDRVPERLALARDLGATHTINSAQETLPEALASITGGRGSDVSVDTTGNISVIESLCDTLAVGGTCGLIGAPAAGSRTSIDVNAFLPGRSVTGITVGGSEPETFIPSLISLNRQGRFPIEKLEAFYRFEDINEAISATSRGEAIKPVLTF